MVSVGSASVSIVPDARGFREKLDAQLRGIASKISVVIDGVGVREQIDAITTNHTATIKASLDDTGVREQLDEITRDRKAIVDVDADTAKFQAEIAAIVKDRVENIQLSADVRPAEAKIDELRSQLRDATIRLDVDTAQADAKIAAVKALIAQAKAKLTVDVNDEAAKVELEALQNELKTIQARVDADTAPAKAKIAALRAEITARGESIRVDADTSGADSKMASLGASAGGAGGQVSALVAAGAAIAPAIVPAAAAAAGALIGIGSGAIAGGVGIGVLALGLSGIVSAISSVTKAQTASGASAAANAAAQVAAAQRVQSAEAGVKSAEAALANARANAADAARRSAQAVLQAQQGVGTATQQAAQSVAQAVAQEASAEQSLRDALQQETDAQKALSDARKQAKRDLQDLNNSVTDNALAQRQAAIDVENARQALLKMQATPGASTIQQQQAQLDYDQAIQHQKELALQQSRLIQQQNQSQKAGVNGAPGVVAAQNNLTKAHQGVSDAQKNVADAQKAITAARVAGAQQINQAEQNLANAEAARASQERQSAYSVAQAQQQVVNSQRSLQAAYTKTGTTASAASSTAQVALAKLTPEGRKLVDFITGTIIPGFHKLSSAAQAPIAAGILAGLQAMRPLIPVVTPLIATLAGVLGQLLDSAGKALGSPFWVNFFRMISSIAAPTVKIFGDIIGNVVTGFAGMITTFEPIGAAIGGAIDDMSKKFRDFGTGKGGGLQKFFDYVMQVGPLVVGTIGSLFKAAGHIVIALAPLGTTVLGWIKGFADWISRIPTKTLQDVAKYAILAVGAMKGFQAVSGIASTLAELGPAGLIVAAIAGGFLLLYQNSKQFRDFINKELIPVVKDAASWLWDHLGKALSDLWGYIQKNVVPILIYLGRQALAGARDGVKQVTKAIQDNRPELEQLWAGFKKVVDFIVKYILPLFGPILKSAFQVVGDQITVVIDIVGALVDAWDGLNTASQATHKAVVRWFGAIGDFFTHMFGRGGTVRTIFSDGVTAIGNIWKGLEALAKAPISFVINTVLNKGLIPAYNWVAGVLPGVKKIGPVRVSGFADGGMMPGYTPGRDVHRFYSPTGGVLDLSGGEPVLRPEAGRVLGPGWVNGINAAARGGGVGGVRQFLGGAHQALAQGGSLALRSMGGSASNFLGDALGSVGESYPIGYCLAFVTNLAGSGIRPGIYDAISAWRDSNRKHPGLVPSAPAPVFWGGGSAGHGHVAAYVGNGQIVSTDAPVAGHVGKVPLGWISQHWGLPYLGWAGTGGSSGAYKSGGGLLSGIVEYVGQLRNKIAGPLDALKSISGTPWGSMVAAAPKAIASAMINSAKNLAGNVIGGISGAAASGTNKARGLALLTAAGFNPLTQWPPLEKLWQRESGWSTTNTNPTSGAYGIPQALPATKMASAGPDWRTNPNTQIRWGLQDIKDTYGNPAAAWAHELAFGWYDQGGWLKPGMTLVHNDTGKPEPVFSPSQWDALKAAKQPSIVVDVHGNDIKDEQQLARAVMTRFSDAWTMYGMTMGG